MFSDLSMSSDVQLSIVAINLILLNFTYAAYMYVNDIIFFINVFRVHTEDFLSIRFAYKKFHRISKNTTSSIAPKRRRIIK